MKYHVKESSSLLEALALAAPEVSRNHLRLWIKHGRITIDGIVAKKGGDQVLPGQEIVLTVKQRMTDDNIQVLFEDEHLAVVRKPAGLLSVASVYQEERTLHALLKKHYYPRRVYVVHRLDQGTSGVMLFAFSKAAFRGLKEIFAKHEIERKYVAVIEGALKKKEGTWRSYLYEDEQYHVYTTRNKKMGQLAITHYKEVARGPDYSLLDVQLETGKKNQIRVHCKEAGCPVAGDQKYGAKTDPAKRLCLHAYALGFHHPVTGKWLHFEVPPPVKFHRLVQE